MFESNIKRFMKNIILVFFTLTVGLLTYLALFNNASVSWDEHTTVVYDNPFVQIGYFILIVVVVYIIRKKYKTQDSRYFKKVFMIVALLLLIIWTFIIFTKNIFPVADQQDILNSATALRNGDFSPFLPSGYVGKCSNQAGIVMILYYLSFVFGDNNYQAFQVLNIFGLIFSYYTICKISKLSFNSDELQNWTLFFLLLFVPLSFYITFVYGNIFGLAFSLYAILCGYQYFEVGKIRYILLAILSIMFAMMFKSNYSITLVAMICFLILDIIVNKKWTSLLLMFLLIPAYFGSTMIPAYLVNDITGIQLGKGIPMIAYVEMGLQDSETSPGWFNGYNWNVYTNNNSDYDQANNQAKSDLSNTLGYYMSNPGQFIDFMKRKTISQWCNPDFQGFWLWRHTDSYIQNDLAYYLLNALQSVILLGTLAYIFITGKHAKLHRLLLPTVFIGGFLFHLVWEAKSQYTITYFVLLIPYCARGIIDITNELNDKFLQIRVAKGFGNKISLAYKMHSFRYLVFMLLSCLILNMIYY